MAKADQSDMLRHAADLIEQVLRDLDGSHTTCPCCNLRVWTSPLEGRTIDQFGETPAKLRNAARRLDNIEEPIQQSTDQRSTNGESEYDGRQDY